MRRILNCSQLACLVAVFAVLVGMASAAGPELATAVLQPAAARKPAPALSLEDSSGKIMKLNSYRGKIVLLDFWATWCHGCKQEIPWFAGFSRKYRHQGLQVIGVSLDGDGWKVVKPFIAAKRVPYRIVLGSDATSKEYGIGSMPDTYLIDRKGRIAAAYTGLVDKQNVEKNIQALLAEKQEADQQ